MKRFPSSRWCSAWIGGVMGVGALALGAGPAMAQSPPIPPAPPSTGAEVPQTYFGPPPTESFSEGSKFLRGPQQLLRSGKISSDHTRITLPLYLGHTTNGRNVWYILTDTSDKPNADALGLNFSAKLAYGAAGARGATLGGKDASLTFASGSVDFGPARKIVPGKAPNFFPPAVAKPGAIADANYSPYVRITNQPGTPIYNAPVVAEGVSAAQLQRYCKGAANHSVVADRVTHICPKAQSNGQGTVTLETTPVFSFGQPATYVSMDASDPLVATLDKGTFAPRMGNLPVGRDDSAFSAVERLFVTANGPTGRNNPQRQGLNSALSDKDRFGRPLPPLQVIGGVPNNSNDYSPAWDLNLGFWTSQAIKRGYRARLIDEFQLLTMVKNGWITGEGGRRYGSTGIVVNCPIVERL
jgi:hypothetical protein